MTFRVRITRQGARDVESILDHLAADSPQTAEHFSSRFSEIVKALTRFDISRATRDSRYRFVNTHPFRYLIFLRRNGNDIAIIAVRHGSRDPRSMPAQPR